MEGRDADKSRLLSTIANFPRYATLYLSPPPPPLTSTYTPCRDLLGVRPQLCPRLAGGEKAYATTGTRGEREKLEALMEVEKEALAGQRARAL